MNHPMQPIYKDKLGTIRFRANGIIRLLCDKKIIDLNEISRWSNTHPGISQDDVDQFWQLLGYSVGGYSELADSDLVSRDASDRAELAAEQLKSESADV